MKKTKRQILTLFLAFTMCITAVDVRAYADTTQNAAGGSGWDGVTNMSVYEGENFRVTFSLTAQWEGGFNANVRIDNTGTEIIENWSLGLDYPGTLSHVWNAEIVAGENGHYTMKNAGWNQDIPVGGSVEFGIGEQEDFCGFPTNYELIGELSDVSMDDYAAAYTLVSDWGSGFSATISISNRTEQAIEDWVLEFDFDREITDLWNGVIESHAVNHYVIRNAGYNSMIAAGAEIVVGFNGTGGRVEDEPQAYSVHQYSGGTAGNKETTDQETDTDGDGLSDDIEDCLGTDKNQKDTDGDGLSDYEELYYTLTDPLMRDTDENGIEDGQEDIDGDGLDNLTELSYGTDPLCADTDSDNLTDYQEIYEYHTDPFIEDTDGDGLSDYDDVALGFSPLLQDTDGNGVLDPDERVEQCLEESFEPEDGRGVTSVSVVMSINGNISNQVGINNVYELDAISRDVVGLVGVPVDIRTKADFETAQLIFTYDESALGDIKEEDLAILWYDEANNWYQILDDKSVVDTVKNTVTLTTTHFSTYMLVNRLDWYQAWRENIDYRISTEDDAKKHYFDVAFVVDVSGSMFGERIRNAKDAVVSFTEALLEGDEAALISFDSDASLVHNFTGDKQSFETCVRTRLFADGGTNVNNGLRKALEIFNGRATGREKMIVLICDGDVNYVQSTIDECINQKIKIYAVNIASASAHYLLQKMADQTGGQYYYGKRADELNDKFAEIISSTVNKIDPTDTDGDGLYDIYENAGMVLANGRVIKTNPRVKDTDGDGLTDFQETGMIYNVDRRYIGYGEYINAKYFVMRSDPTKPDTDEDGIGDKDDPKPWEVEYIITKLANKYDGVDFLRVEESKGVYVNGGNQNWWKELASSQEKFNYDDYKKDRNYGMWQLGCGVIAMTDLELYLTQQNTGYSAENNQISYDQGTGIIKKEDYMRYAEKNRDDVYPLYRIRWLNYLAGVLPGDMEVSLKNYLNHNRKWFSTVKWAPRLSYIRQKDWLLNDIEKMLKNNLPVVCSYDASVTKKELYMYDTLKDARAGLEKTKNKEPIVSHYMTIIGTYKYLDKTSNRYETILKVESWGNIYYVRYDDYSPHLSYATNILRIT